MIRARFFSSNGHYVSFCIEGHSGYDIKGKDIVCAAVSALAQHTARSLTKYCGAIVEKKQAKLNVLLPQPSEFSDILVRELHESIEDIHSQYPQNLSVEVVINEDRHTVVRS
ncbi:ribosomal-processing cysteine protease Prp [Pseudothermotoga sp.]|uniref:ribosomal-processing cysteine protease Prp n=1 Tax=Pseudothermotoga sp. TaxID=2033661 RepID=UPI0031F6E27E